MVFVFTLMESALLINTIHRIRHELQKQWLGEGIMRGLKYKCTTKGSHEGTGGKVVHFIAAIAHGKGMVLCEQYHGKLSGQSFASFVQEHFPGLFHNSSNPKGKLFLQDGDPSQNSKKAKEAIHGMGARKFSIPPRSPDMNPIENIFHLVKRKLNSDAIENNITHEGFKEFSE